MRIIINDHLGRAPPVQLSRSLAARGHEVLHLYSADIQQPKADLQRHDGDPTGLTIEGISVDAPGESGFIRQRMWENRLGRKLHKRAVAFRPDIVMAGNNPLDAQRQLQNGIRSFNARFVYWLHQFQASDLDRKVEGRSALIQISVGSYYHALERKLLQRSDAIIAATYDLLGVLAEGWGIYDRQCMVIAPWAALRPSSSREAIERWKSLHGFGDKRLVIYTGSLSPLEEPDFFVRLAERLLPVKNVLVLVISEGSAAEHLRTLRQTRELNNLEIMPFQPYEIYEDVLASADVLIAALAATSGILSVPSKVDSYLTAGRPIVLAGPWQNRAATSVRESGGGTVVDAGDDAAAHDAILRFISDDSLRQQTGERARQYAEQTFEISKITDRFERLFERLCKGVPRHRQSR